MALTDENGGTGMVMPVAPMYGGGYGNNGGGFFGGDWAWIILLLLIGGGGWGLGGFGMGGMMPWMMGGAMGGFGLDYLYPWLNNSQHISDGFRDQNLQTSISGLQNSVTAGFGDVQNALCSGFAGVNATVNGAHNALAQQLYTNQIADLERSYAAQTANTAGMTALQAQLAQCCCDNRAATADLKYTVAAEECATRANDTQNTQGVLNAINGGIQSIKDQLCQYRNDHKDDLIAQLRQEVLFSRGQASQDVQTAAIRAGQATTANQLVQELRSCPIPAMPVYGMTPVFTCPSNTNTGCGCGCTGATL